VGTGRTESLTAMAFQAYLIAASMLATMKMGIVTGKAFFMRQTELLKHQVCGRITNLLSHMYLIPLNSRIISCDRFDLVSKHKLRFPFSDFNACPSSKS
jgi:hypothetical protein